MRILLAVHNYYNDPITGAMHVLRTAMKWLAEAGHSCRVLCTVRMDTSADLRPLDHLAKLGIKPRRVGGGREGSHTNPAWRYTVDGVDVTMLQTRHNLAKKPDPPETRWFLNTLDEMIRSEPPDVVVGYGIHPVIPAAFKAARAAGAATVVRVANKGQELRGYYKDVDRVITCSGYLSGYYRDVIGLISTPIAPAMDWSQIVAPTESRAFLTFVNPLRRKGAGVFARVADMLGSRRPDIPILVVQSAGSASMLNSIPGIDFAKYPQIMAAPAVDMPAEFLALTKLLMVPSVWPEPFGRVAAEAMINGIPPLVSDRGALAGLVGGDASAGGGGRVLGIPGWMDEHSAKIVSEPEALPWVDAVCDLWDNTEAYRQLSDRARAIAEDRYSERTLRPQYIDAITNITPRGSVLEG